MTFVLCFNLRDVLLVYADGEYVFINVCVFLVDSNRVDCEVCILTSIVFMKISVKFDEFSINAYDSIVSSRRETAFKK